MIARQLHSASDMDLFGVRSMCAVILTLSTAVDTAKKLSGPYDVELSKVETCDDEGTGQIHGDTKISYVGEGKHVYNSPFSFGVPFDEKIVLKGDVQSWSSQGWRPRAITYTAKGCKEIMKIFGSFFKSFYKSAGVNVTECPYPAGNFTAHNWVVAFEFEIVPVIIYNKYKGVFSFFYEDVKVGCVIFYVETVPKKNS